MPAAPHRGNAFLIPGSESKATQDNTSAGGRHGCFTRCPSFVSLQQAVRRGSFSRRKHTLRESSIPGAREKTSREEAPPQTQPETPVRVSGDPRKRNLRQGEEGQGKVR